MKHSIELEVHHYKNQEDEFFNESTLEVVFNIIDNSYEITKYFLDNENIGAKKFERLKEFNLNLNDHIDYEIDNYIANHEEEPISFDCD